MATVVVGSDHVAAPADQGIGLRQRADAMAIAVEAVAGAGRFGLRRRHGRGAGEKGRGGANQSRHCKPPACGNTRGWCTQRTLLAWHVALAPESLKSVSDLRDNRGK